PQRRASRNIRQGGALPAATEGARSAACRRPRHVHLSGPPTEAVALAFEALELLPEHDDFSLNRHRASSCSRRMIFSKAAFLFAGRTQHGSRAASARRTGSSHSCQCDHWCPLAALFQARMHPLVTAVPPRRALSRRSSCSRTKPPVVVNCGQGHL